jgi:acetyl esterase/lipase
VRALIDAGRPITLRVYPGAMHGLFTPMGPAPFWEDVREWLEEKGVRAAR